jgi:hypothetical protein
LKNEPKILPFQKELYEIVDGFGYEWKGVGTNIILNLDKKNLLSYDESRFIEKLVSRLSNHGLKKQNRNDKLLKDINSKFTILKNSAFREVFADITLIVIFSLILYHLIFVAFTLLGVAIDLFAIAVIIRSFLYSINEIFMNDQTILSKKFGFKKNDMGFTTSSYNVLRMIKHSKYMVLLSSALILTPSILSLTYPSPPLTYVIGVINFLALLLASLQMIFQYYKNRKKHRNLNGLNPTLLAVVLVSLFFIIYVMNYFIDYTPTAFFSSFFVDNIIIYSVPYFVRDLIRINKFRKWADSINGESYI